MKLSITLSTMLLLSCLYAFAETEPNNTIEQANEITLSSQITGQIASGDVDWFKVTLPEDGELTVTVNCDDGVEVNNLEIYEGTSNNRIKGGTYGNSASVSFPNCGKGLYYIRVAQWRGAGSYNLIADLTPAALPSDNEPNNNVDDAQLVAVNSSTTGRLYYLTDNVYDKTDWFAVTIPDNGRITISVECEESLEVNNIKIYDTNKTTQLASGSYGKTASVTSHNLLQGTYYINIPRWSGYGSYTMTNTFTIANLGSDNEPNNDITQAQPTGLNETITGQLYYQQGGVYDTQDWFSVTIPDDGKLTFKVECDETLEVSNLEIFDKDALNHVITGSYGRVAEVSYPNFTAGTYFLKVTRYSGYGSYTLTNIFEPASYPSDSYNNDSIHLAQHFELNDSITGRLYYRDNQKYDTRDWFSVTIPDDGKLTFIVECEETLQVNNLEMYDKDALNHITSGSYGDTATVSFPNLTAGTYFVLVSRYSGYGSYVLRNEFIPASYPSDSYDNDSIHLAQHIELNDSITGRLFYRDNQKHDTRDWFSVTIPDDGKLTFIVECEETLQVNNLEIYDKDALNRITSGSYGDTAVVSYPNLTAGTYYLLATRYSGYGSYVLRNEFTAAAYPSDSYNNDSIHLAQHIELNDTITGRLFYRDNQKYDTKDWFMVVLPNNGNIKFSVNTTDNLEVNNLRIHNKNGAALKTGSYGAKAEVELIKTQYDTLYLEVARYSGYGSYKLVASYLPAPTSIFEVYQNLHSIAIMNKSVLATSSTWDFGDGNTTTEVSPRHTYEKPGVYTLQLVSENAAGTDTLRTTVEIKGVRSFSPLKGGNSGDVTLTAVGGGFSENSKIWIEYRGNKIYPDTTLLVEAGVLRGTFDLRGQLPGSYEVSVQIDENSIFKSDEPFVVKQGGKANPWVNIIGRDKTLFNRWQTYTINYGNSGDVDATGVPLWILLPRGEDIEEDFSRINIGIPITDDPIWEEMRETMPVYMDIDYFEGEPFEGRLYPLFVPFIPAGESYSIQFRIKTPRDIDMYTWVSPPYFQSPVNPDVADCIRWAQLRALKDGMVSILSHQLPGVACVNSVLQSIYDLTYGDSAPVTSHLWNISRSTFTCAAEFVGPLKAYQLSVAVIELGLDIYGNYSAENECNKKKPKKDDEEEEEEDPPFSKKPLKGQKVKAVSSFDPNEIIGPKGATENNYVPRNIDYEYSIYFENMATATAPAHEVLVIDTLDLNVFDIKTFNLEFVNFGDSTIYIPQGGYEFTTDVDLRPNLESILRISASVDTATGVAKWYYVTLDPEYYDLHEDPDAGFLPPNKIAPEGEGYVGFTISLLPDVPENTPISNKATIFFDLNPPIETNLYVNHIDETAPLSGMRVANEKYDEEEPIISLEWYASDSGSGIETYTIYLKENDSDSFVPILSNTKQTAYDYVVEPNSKYQFKCIATDKTGNTESLSKANDLLVNVPSHVVAPVIEKESLIVTPNPASNEINLSFTTSVSTDILISIVNIQGVAVFSKNLTQLPQGNHSELINISDLPQGIYQVLVQSGPQIRSKKLLKINEF